MMADTTMRWGLLGASRIAEGNVIGAIRANGGEIAAVLGSDVARTNSYADRNDIPGRFGDVNALLAEAPIDAVYVSTTNERHHSLAMAAIAAGKHVLCEKPLAVTLVDAVEMVQAARDAGMVFATNHHLRHQGSHRAIREAVRAGRIGDVLSVRVHHAVSLPDQLRGWRIDDPGAGGGVVLDITVHDADTVRFHLNEEPIEVVARTTQSGLGHSVEDSAMSVWTMPSGAMVHTHESFTHPFAGTGIELHGTKGSIFGRNVMVQAPGGSAWIEDADGRHDVPFEDGDPYERVVAMFHDAVRNDSPVAADGVDGIKSLAVALAVREAASSGRATTVDYGRFGS